MENGLKIRLLGREDLDACRAIVSETMGEGEGEKAWKDLAHRPGSLDRYGLMSTLSTRFVAELDGEVVGVCGIYAVESNPKDLAGVGWFAVSPKMQGKGIGKALLEAAAAEAKKEGKKRLFVWAAPNAVGFYEKLGFRRTRVRMEPVQPTETAMLKVLA